MALGTPEYVYTQAPLDPDFYTVTCRFQNKDGEYGEARHVLGKKKAKGECARLTVMWLEEEYERRMSMVRGAVGGAGKDRAEENGKGKAVVKEGDEHSDSFEDAVEEMEM